MMRALIVGAVVAGLALATGRPASAEERARRGTLGRITVDNLRPARSRGSVRSRTGPRMHPTAYRYRSAVSGASIACTGGPRAVRRRR